MRWLWTLSLCGVCIIVALGCPSNPADSADDEQPTIVGVWKRDADDLWEFTQDDSFFVLIDAAREYCVINRGTFEVDGDSIIIAVEVPDTFCAGTWELRSDGDSLVLNLGSPCEPQVMFELVDGPDHTEVAACE